jgi:hydroxyethylthiazole kinase-like uncharacterized protein yjeF
LKTEKKKQNFGHGAGSPVLKARKPESRKGDNGKVLVVAGSGDYTGSAYLCAMAVAALRSGTDLVTVACPEKVAWAINAMSPDVITAKLKGDYLAPVHFRKLKRLAEKNNVLLIGPGISRKKWVAGLVKKLVKLRMPKVIDADALKMIRLQDVENAVLTPHKREFEILLKNSGIREKQVLKKIRGNVILLKGPTDEIYSGRKVMYVSGGNEGMTTGGTGDVLAGICAGLLSQGNDLFTSAYFASKLNKKIGDRLKKRIGIGFIASDFLAEIAKEANRHRQGK